MMTTFQDGLAICDHFNDFDAMAAETAGWDLTFSQVGSGAFSGSTTITSTARIHMGHQAWSAPLLVEGQQPSGAVSIAVTLSAEGGVRWLGKEFDWTRSMIGGKGAHSVNFLTHGATELIAVSIQQDVFEAHLWERFGIEGSTLGDDLHLPIAPDAADCPRRGRALVTLSSVLMSGAAQTPAARQRIDDAVLQILLDGVASDALPMPIPFTARRRMLRAAEDILRARLDDPPSMHELCHLTGASERTLHAAFQEAFGLPPKRYLRTLRLNAARRRLRRGEANVTEVAMELGFFHLARFAEDYRALFLELPSETLRRARGGALVPGA